MTKNILWIVTADFLVVRLTPGTIGPTLVRKPFCRTCLMGHHRRLEFRPQWLPKERHDVSPPPLNGLIQSHLVKWIQNPTWDASFRQRLKDEAYNYATMIK